MKILKPTVCAAVLSASVLLPAFCASAQESTPVPATPSVSAPTPAPPGGGGGGPEAFRQRINERLKTALKATDEEWNVIQPMLEKVEEKQRDVLMSRFGGLMGRGGPGGEGRRRQGAENGGNNAQPAGEQTNGGGNNNRQQRRGGPPSSAEAQALEAALQDDNTNVNDIKIKLAAVRDERTKANADLAAAREDLKKVLNMRQEAVLVLAGMLD